MAAYPCSIGLHRYSGAQRSAYITIVQGARPATLKWRLCSRHFAESEAACKTWLAELTEDGQMSLVCEYRNCQVERECTVFAKYFGEDSEGPREYASDLCAAHARDVRLALQVDHARPVREG